MRLVPRRLGLVAALALALAIPPATAQQPAPPAPGTILLTIFLKHDQSKTVEQINEQLRAQKYFESFPPKDIEIVSWYVMMGIGQVVTLRVPAERLREVNLSIERTAWGGFRTEFYPTYDYRPVYEAMKKSQAK
jgi:hypothetical protein